MKVGSIVRLLVAGWQVPQVLAVAVEGLVEEELGAARDQLIFVLRLDRAWREGGEHPRSRRSHGRISPCGRTSLLPP